MKKISKKIQLACFFTILIFALNSCQAFKYKKVSAKDFPPDPNLRVKKNIEEGRGFRLSNTIGGGKGGTFDFASSNELWRASLDTIDFIPLASANYSGGIIITDWYNDSNSPNQSIKITIRFLSNEIRVDALDIKVFTKNCYASMDCKITENKGILGNELKKKILEKAALYAKANKDKNFRPYTVTTPGDNKDKTN